MGLAQTDAVKQGKVALVGMNYKDEAENARRFLGALGNPFSAVGTDPAGRGAIEWGVYGVPETFVIGPDGHSPVSYTHLDVYKRQRRDRGRDDRSGGGIAIGRLSDAPRVLSLIHI